MVRTGRPTNNPKNKILQIRISESEKEKLTYCVEKTGKTQTEIIIEGISNIYDGLLKGK